MSSVTYRKLNLDTIWGLSWEQSKKYAVLIILNIAAAFAQRMGGMVSDTTQLMTLLQDPSLVNDPEKLNEAISVALLAALPTILLGALLGWLIVAYFNVAINRLLIDGVKGLELNLTERIKGAWNGYVQYVIVNIALFFILIIGFACCVLPGLYLAVRLVLVPIIAANKPHLKFSEVFSESWRLTEGHFWTLLGYGIVAFLVNIVGFICCCVGILFTELIAQFMLANVYYTLSGEYEDETPDAAIVEDKASTSGDHENDEDRQSEGNYARTY